MSAHLCFVCKIDDPEGKRPRRKILPGRAPLWCVTHRRQWKKSGLRRGEWLEARS